MFFFRVSFRSGYRKINPYKRKMIAKVSLSIGAPSDKSTWSAYVFIPTSLFHLSKAMGHWSGGIMGNMEISHLHLVKSYSCRQR